MTLLVEQGRVGAALTAVGEQIMPRGVVPSLIVAHGLAVAALVIAVGWTHHKPRPCLKTFERVQKGMTREQVEVVVGGPVWTCRPQRGDEDRLWCQEMWWVGDDAVLRVSFSDDGIAQDVSVELSTGIPSIACRLWSWVTTGYDLVIHYPHGCAVWVPHYELDVLRNILCP